MADPYRYMNQTEKSFTANQRLLLYNLSAYDVLTNRFGLGEGGQYYLLEAMLADMQAVGNSVYAQSLYAQAAAAQVAAVQTGTYIKNMSPTMVTNAGFGVCSNGTIESAISSVNLVANGNFEVDLSGFATGNSASQTRDTSTYAVGAACLKLTNTAAAWGFSYTTFSVIAGHCYKIALWCKRGTSALVGITVGTALAQSQIIPNTGSTNTTWARYEYTFEALATATYYLHLFGDATSGTTAYFDGISIYDMGTNLATNGTFDSVSTGWNVFNGTQSLTPSGISVNCLQLVNGASVQAYSGQNFSVTVGKLYRVGAWLLAGTSAANMFAQSTGGAYNYGGVLNSAGNWAYKTILLEAQTNSLTVQLVNGSNTTGQIAYYDSVTVTEVTVGCTDGNSLAFDGWAKDISASCFRETINTKGGSYYAARVFNGNLTWGPRASVAAPDACMQFAGRSAVLGCWVQSYVSGKTFLYVSDGISTVQSSIHSGSGNYEWLECSLPFSSLAAQVSIGLCSGAGVVANFSQPQLQYGISIGQGNFVPQQNEYIYLDAGIPSSAYSSHGRLSSSSVTIYRSADSQGKLPKFVKTLIADVSTADTASGYYTATINNVIVPSVSYGWTHLQVAIKDIYNGAMPIAIVASGSSTFELLMQYVAVTLY